MGLPPPPAFSRGQKGLPSLSRVLAFVLQDGSHGACLCFRHFPGTASGCKAALHCHETLFVFVPLPFPLCLWPSGSFTASGFYCGPLWSAFWTPLSAFFLGSPVPCWWFFNRGLGPLHLVQGTLLSLPPAPDSTVPQWLAPWSHAAACSQPLRSSSR